MRGLDRDPGGLAVADLADHHDVGVGAQDRAERVREGQAGARVDLHLADAGEPVLDRVLDGDDVDLGPADLGERRVERRRLARAGRAGDEQRAGRARENHGPAARASASESPSAASVGASRDLSSRRIVTDSPSTVGSVATRMSSRRPAAAALSVMRPSCGLRRSAMSSFASTFRRVVTPAASRFGNALGDVEHAVDPVADDQRVLLRLEVDVAGPVLGGLEDERVDEPHERRVGDAVVGLEVVLVLVEAGHVADERGIHRLGGARQPADLGEHVFSRGDEELDRVPRGEAELVEAVHVLRVGDRDLEVAAVGGERDRADALEHRQRDDLRRLGVDARDREVDERQLVLLGERRATPSELASPSSTSAWENSPSVPALA